MQIKLSPVRSDESLSVSRSGDIVTVNGVPFDFSQLPEGAELPATAISSDWFTCSVERINGAVHLTLKLPHAANPSQEVAFPVQIDVTKDGIVELPK